ncbi:hypothetical protein AB0A74_31130 [Saccharothrix sp. NPDC042600]|uniref:hypothetical protein n=1 Tax=Saccharothrix TaxID=2071 RepID=UPI0033CA4584|nr:hypothetical protein GCM10017745_19760 [Saccharothrix mutabilis subsp. capreolus]
MDLHQVFADVPRVGEVDGCTYCYPQHELDLLGGDPALVPDDLVTSFAREVTDHWSEGQYGLLWRGLAPRILAALEASPDELLLHGLTFAHFSEWPRAEQDAVRAELRAMIARAIDHQPPRHTHTLICAAAHADRDLTPWLDHLHTLPDPGVAALARYWAHDVGGGYEPTLWYFPEDPAAPIRAWLGSDALRDRLARLGDADTLIAIAEALAEH